MRKSAICAISALVLLIFGSVSADQEQENRPESPQKSQLGEEVAALQGAIGGLREAIRAKTDSLKQRIQKLTTT